MDSLFDPAWKFLWSPQSDKLSMVGWVSDLTVGIFADESVGANPAPADLIELGAMGVQKYGGRSLGVEGEPTLGSVWGPI